MSNIKLKYIIQVWNSLYFLGARILYSKSQLTNSHSVTFKKELLLSEHLQIAQIKDILEFDYSMYLMSW